ncbi:Hypothetical protein POVR1_LOCUS388 [uncultured virus]|nr:Hypothetical protein POVR1_LOCUS388 [uncultured virus]
MDHRIYNIKKTQQAASDQHNVNLELLRSNPLFKSIEETYDDIGKKKKCTIRYLYNNKEHTEGACGGDKYEAKNATITRIVEMIQHFQRFSLLTSNESSSSSSNDPSLSAELVYDSLQGRIIRCLDRSVGGLEHGLYYVDQVEPKHVKREHVNKIISYREASQVSKHPWLHILMIFGNNMLKHKKSYYYILCGDNEDSEYTAVATTIEELKF